MPKETNEFSDHLRMKIVYYRKKAGLTQSEVAKKMGMTRTAYAYTETKAARLNPDFLTKLAEVLGISPAVFVERQSIKPQIASNEPSAYVATPFATSNKEQRIIKMLRMLSGESYEKIYEIIRNEYENTMLSDD